ncbi:MAG: nucleotidyltransferase family protein [bacterium]|nr:nucleotidyltransferase family protein [bacterium]
MSTKIKQAIILAGGKGERLRPHTDNRPKPMVEVNGKPIIAYILEQVKSAGIEKVVVACSYKREVLQEYLDHGHKFGLEITYSVEDSPLGRGGGIKQSMKYLTPSWEDVLVMNGDQLWKLDVQGLMEKHQAHKAIATVVVVPLKSPYGIVEFDKKGQILGFREKPMLPHWINGGIYVFSKEIEPMLPEVGDHETETFPMLSKKRFIVFQSTNYWRGVDTVKDLAEAEKEVAELFKD